MSNKVTETPSHTQRPLALSTLLQHQKQRHPRHKIISEAGAPRHHQTPEPDTIFVELRPNRHFTTMPAGEDRTAIVSRDVTRYIDT
jgi:hypothetical protein